jgi:NADPH:quinone reductase-like Zn-dependent oxidoreductase
MKTIVITRHGGPDVLQLLERDLPEPSRKEVRIKVSAAGVAFADILMRYGLYPGAPPVPFAPGYDIVGVVDAVGADVTGFKPGDNVAALIMTGGYSQFLVLPETELVRVPVGLDPAEAVSLVLNYTTAYQTLHRIANVQNGERILVHGAGGGVGTAALELGRIAGLEMYGTASKGKQELIRSYGAHAIDYKSEDFVARIRELTGTGVDVALDPVGGTNWWRSYQVLRKGGKLIGYGMSAALSGQKTNKPVAVGSFLLLGLLKAFPGKSAEWFNVKTLKEKRPDWFREDLTSLMNLLAEKKLHPVVAQRLPLDQAQRAHQLLESAAVTGKIVLMCQE